MPEPSATWNSCQSEQAQCQLRGKAHYGLGPVGVGEPVGAGPFQHSGLRLPHAPPAMVFQRVITPTQVRQIVSSCRAALFGSHRMVEIAAMWRTRTAREATASIPDTQESAQLLGRTIGIDREDQIADRISENPHE